MFTILRFHKKEDGKKGQAMEGKEARSDSGKSDATDLQPWTSGRKCKNNHLRSLSQHVHNSHVHNFPVEIFLFPPHPGPNFSLLMDQDFSPGRGRSSKAGGAGAVDPMSCTESSEFTGKRRRQKGQAMKVRRRDQTQGKRCRHGSSTMDFL